MWNMTFCTNPIVCATHPSILLCVFIYGQTLKKKAKHPKMGTDGVCLLSQIILWQGIKTSKAHVWQPAVQDTKQTPLTSSILLLKRPKLAPLPCTSAELLLVCNSESKERNQPLCVTNTAETQTWLMGIKETENQAARSSVKLSTATNFSFMHDTYNYSMLKSWIIGTIGWSSFNPSESLSCATSVGICILKKCLCIVQSICVTHSPYNPAPVINLTTLPHEHIATMCIH